MRRCYIQRKCRWFSSVPVIESLLHSLPNATLYTYQHEPGVYFINSCARQWKQCKHPLRQKKISRTIARSRSGGLANRQEQSRLVGTICRGEEMPSRLSIALVLHPRHAHQTDQRSRLGLCIRTSLQTSCQEGQKTGRHNGSVSHLGSGARTTPWHIPTGNLYSRTKQVPKANFKYPPLRHEGTLAATCPTSMESQYIRAE